jgi:hypothetical protein
MISTLAGGDIGSVMVMATEGRGSTPEEVAERALDKIIYVGSASHPAIRDQAEAFKVRIRAVLVHYMHEAVRSHNVTLVNKFKQAGHPELTAILDT